MKSTAKTVGIVMIIMMLSRMLSLVSTVFYTTVFGNVPQTNIYSFALMVPNIIFTIFGTALSTVVIPIFSGNVEKGDRKKAFRFADNVISLSLIVTMFLTVVGILLAPLFISFTKFKTDNYDFAILALRILMPVMIFYALNYIFQGILQSLGKFNMPAFVTVPSALILIGYLFFFSERFGVKGLLIATLIGLSTQALILIPPILKTDYRYRPSFDYRDEDIKKAMKLMIPIMSGTSAYQMNMFFNIFLTANFEGTVALFKIVQDLVSNSILVFIYSLTAVMFPKFSMLAAKGDMGEFKENLVRVIKSILYFLLPATVGFVLVRNQLMSLLVGWGQITRGDVSLASAVMGLYALGITGVGIKEVVDRVFYSLKDTKRPAIIGVVVMGINICVSLLLIRFMGAYGIPLGNSVSVLAGAMVLLILLRKKIGSFKAGEIVKSSAKILLACAIMGGVVILVSLLINNFTFGVLFMDRVLKLFVPSIFGAVTYGVATYILKVEQTTEVLNKVKLKFFHTKG